MKKLSWLGVVATPILSGCVSLSTLNDESLKAGGAVAIPTEQDPCPERSAGAGLLQVEANLHSANRSATSSAIAAVRRQESDLDTGKAIIAATNRMAIAGTGADFLGMDLAQFAEDLPLLDDRGADAADAALASPATTAMMAAMVGRGEAGAATSSDLTLRRRDMRQLADNIGTATGTTGWTASLAESLGAFHRAGGFEALAAGQVTPDQRAALQDIFKKYLLAAYFKAYFRNGAIFRLEVLDDALTSRLRESIAQRIQDPVVREALGGDIDAIIARIRAQICTGGQSEPCFAFGVIGDESFVTRAGKSHGFPGITGQFQPLGDDTFTLDTPEWNPVIGDLVRVFVEAVGDSVFAVPGVRNSTACEQLQRLCGEDNQTQAITKVNEAGDRVEASARSITSVAIRGGWLFSLNNEALATSIETLISVSARKIAERATWSRENVCVGALAASPHRAIRLVLE